VRGAGGAASARGCPLASFLTCLCLPVSAVPFSFAKPCPSPPPSPPQTTHAPQFGDKIILDYLTHQRRLLPGLAATYAFHLVRPDSPAHAPLRSQSDRGKATASLPPPSTFLPVCALIAGAPQRVELNHIARYARVLCAPDASRPSHRRIAATTLLALPRPQGMRRLKDVYAAGRPSDGKLIHILSSGIKVGPCLALTWPVPPRGSGGGGDALLRHRQRQLSAGLLRPCPYCRGRRLCT
jgi:hypothetical protein